MRLPNKKIKRLKRLNLKLKKKDIANPKAEKNKTNETAKKPKNKETKKTKNKTEKENIIKNLFKKQEAKNEREKSSNTLTCVGTEAKVPMPISRKNRDTVTGGSVHASCVLPPVSVANFFRTI